MSFDPKLVAQYLPELIAAFATTLWIWIAGCVFAAAIGFMVALFRRYGGTAIDWALKAYIEILRGTPFLVQLFLLYFGGPFIGLSLEPVPAGLLGLSIYGSAYFAEVFRAGFEAVPRGHVEAAESVGLSRAQIVRRILVPEMTMLVLPAAINLVISLLKDTAILSVITVPELTLIITGIGSKYYAFVEALTLLALFYWGLVELAGRLGAFAEARLSKYRLAT
jgi:polar amino acid transport system permease protein